MIENIDCVLFCFFLFSRVQKECLAFSPILPSDISELSIRGVSYLGHQMDWLLRQDEVCVILREQANTAGNAVPYDLQVVLKESGFKIPLMPGNTQRHARIIHLCSALIENNSLNISKPQPHREKKSITGVHEVIFEKI